MKKNTLTVLVFLVMITVPSTFATRHINPQNDGVGKRKKAGSGGARNNGPFGVIFGPGGGFNIPGLSGGYGGPKGGYARSWIIRPNFVCKEKGPCLGKKLRCPAKCFKSYASSGKGYGYGGGCTMDCNKKCVAYC